MMRRKTPHISHSTMNIGLILIRLHYISFVVMPVIFSLGCLKGVGPDPDFIIRYRNKLGAWYLERNVKVDAPPVVAEFPENAVSDSNDILLLSASIAPEGTKSNSRLVITLSP